MSLCGLLAHFHSGLLVKLLEARLTHSHLFLDAELGDSGAFGGAFATEDLSTCPAVVLKDKKRHTSGNTNTAITPVLLIGLLDYPVISSEGDERLSQKGY